MAAGRVIVALALVALMGVLMMGNVRCSDPGATPSPVTPPPAGSAADAPAARPTRGDTSSASAADPAEGTAGTDAAPLAIPDRVTPDVGDGDGGEANDAAGSPGPAADPAPTDGPAPADDRIPVTIDGRTFRLELAADGDSRAQGLMGRESIEPDGGMLFVFPDVAMRSFWMKNCLTDMDILFLDGSGRVTAIHEMTVEPPRRPDEPEWQYEWRMPGYSSLRPAQFAIELAPRTTRQLDVERGDLIPLDLEGLKRRAR